MPGSLLPKFQLKKSFEHLQPIKEINRRSSNSPIGGGLTDTVIVSESPLSRIQL